jgi:hypothetical protein
MIFAIIGWSYGRATEDSIGRRSYAGAILGVRFLFNLGKSRSLGGGKVIWLCLDILPKGVLEYWSVGVLGFV